MKEGTKVPIRTERRARSRDEETAMMMMVVAVVLARTFSYAIVWSLCLFF